MKTHEVNWKIVHLNIGEKKRVWGLKLFHAEQGPPQMEHEVCCRIWHTLEGHY